MPFTPFERFDYAFCADFPSGMHGIKTFRFGIPKVNAHGHNGPAPLRLLVLHLQLSQEKRFAQERPKAVSVALEISLAILRACKS
jgi:hypothetical protein